MDELIKTQWADFSDFAIIALAIRYGIGEELVFDVKHSLINRMYVERRLTEVEFEQAFT